MPLVCPRKVVALTQNKNKFHFDHTLQIKELAGFHATPSNFAGSDGRTYVHAYCTEKNVTYQLNLGVFRRRQPKELLDKKTEQNTDQDPVDFILHFGDIIPVRFDCVAVLQNLWTIFKYGSTEIWDSVWECEMVCMVGIA
jgi:hypothetical protein